MKQNPKYKIGNIRHLNDGDFDGIYLVFANEGMHQLYTPGTVTDDMKKRCTGVAVKLGEKSLVVDLHDMEDPKDSDEKDLTLTTAKSPADYDKAAYKDTYEDAGADWDGQANTDRLALAGILNPKIAQQLKKGQYVPAMGQLLFVHLFRKQINQALREVGGEEIGGRWYWTSTEYSAAIAWYLSLNNGSMTSSTKASFRGRVRAVSVKTYEAGGTVQAGINCKVKELQLLGGSRPEQSEQFQPSTGSDDLPF